MVQHLLLMTVAAPLILLGAPAIVLLRGVSARFVIHPAGRAFRTRPLRAVSAAVEHPLLCWCAGTLAVVIWHVPPAFALAMSSPGWHAFQRGTFLAAGLLFWWPVIQPWPSSAKWPRWCVPLYLFLATLPCDALSAFFAFCGRTVYPAHLCHSGASPEARLADQASAGALMWFWVTVAYLVPAIRIVVQILSPLGEENDREGAGALIER
jgi:cytochrome c oxidase assembly factor CtaG